MLLLELSFQYHSPPGVASIQLVAQLFVLLIAIRVAAAVAAPFQQHLLRASPAPNDCDDNLMVVVARRQLNR